MPNYDHECYECNYQWEDTYSINAAPPTICPKCSGSARRVITQVPAYKVVLHGRDLKDFVKAEAKKAKAEVSKDENLRANIVGEEKYNENKTVMDKLNSNLTQL